MLYLHWDVQLELVVLKFRTDFVNESTELRNCPIQLLRQRPKTERLKQVAHHANAVSTNTGFDWVCRIGQHFHVVRARHDSLV